jgi:GNAT superfamily N-acetyltransferase
VDEPVLHTFNSKGGRRIELRRLRKEHAHYLVDLFHHMGPESRFLRFNVPLNNPDPDLVWAEAQRMADVEPDRGRAWLAFTDLPGQPQAPVGGLRFIRTSETAAEASLAVRDDLQNQGIGTGLLRFLLEQALEAGLMRLTATISRANRPLFHLIRSSGLDVELEPEGSMTTVTVHLRRELPPEPET